MELLASSMTLPHVLLTIFLVTVAAVTYCKKTKGTKMAPLPPGPRKFPILGNLHNLAGASGEPHQRLAGLSQEHGPLMHLQLGQIPTVVVSSRDAARAILKTHDHKFADRPPLLAARELIKHNCRDIAFAPYGEYWRTMKKISIVELLTAKRVETFRHIRDAAVSMILDRVASGAGTEPVNLSKQFYAVSNWIVSRATFGNTTSKHNLDYVIETMSEIGKLASGMNYADLFPVFETLISYLNGMKRRMRKTMLRMDDVLDTIIKDRMSEYEACNVDEKEEDQDLLNLLLRHYRLQDLDFAISVNDVKAVILDLFIAGTDTTSSALEWAMSEMIKRPDVMLKAQSEVRSIYQEKGKIDESIVDELHYLMLVVKETLRLHPPAPLLLPRQCRETCEINGYLIPVGTRVIVNAWALGRDPNCWVRPDEFYPERFQDGQLDFRGTDYEYIPFGAGRRMCPGATFALANIKITLAKMLCHFDWKLPYGMGLRDLNMEETSGTNIRRKVPLYLIASTRIPL